MKKLGLVLVSVCMLFSVNVQAETATPEEIYEGVLKGAEVLQSLGEEGLVAFNDPKGEFVWKDTYVQVYKCEAKQIVGHINPKILA